MLINSLPFRFSRMFLLFIVSFLHIRLNMFIIAILFLFLTTLFNFWNHSLSYHDDSCYHFMLLTENGEEYLSDNLYQIVYPPLSCLPSLANSIIVTTTTMIIIFLLTKRRNLFCPEKVESLFIFRLFS